MSPRHKVSTKDGVPLDELVEKARRLITIYNDAERPFRDMFVEQVDQQTFFQEPKAADVEWEELAEGEHPRTVSRNPDDKQMFIRDKKYGRGIGYTQEFVEKHTEERVLRRINNMLSGAETVQQDLIMTALDNGIADGRTLWYDVPDYGDHTFTNSHDHWFEDTDALFDNDGTDDTAYAAHRHIEEAKLQLTHHGLEGPFVALTSTQMKYDLRDEISWDAQYHVPMANNMRSSDIFDLDIVIDGTRIVESPWMSDKQMYITQVQNGAPVKFFEDRPVQLTRGTEGGGPVVSPGDLLGANGSARWGVKNVDPLAAVYVNATNVSTT